MARAKKPFGTKGGYKKRKYRPIGYSRAGLPKIFPPDVNPTLRVQSIK